MLSYCPGRLTLRLARQLSIVDEERPRWSLQGCDCCGVESPGEQHELAYSLRTFPVFEPGPDCSICGSSEVRDEIRVRAVEHRVAVGIWIAIHHNDGSAPARCPACFKERARPRDISEQDHSITGIELRQVRLGSNPCVLLLPHISQWIDGMPPDVVDAPVDYASRPSLLGIRKGCRHVDSRGILHRAHRRRDGFLCALAQLDGSKVADGDIPSSSSRCSTGSFYQVAVLEVVRRERSSEHIARADGKDLRSDNGWDAFCFNTGSEDQRPKGSCLYDETNGPGTAKDRLGRDLQIMVVREAAYLTEIGNQDEFVGRNRLAHALQAE